MSFSGTLARKYILTQKRHSVMIILSIIVALTLISSIVSLYSTYRSCTLSIVRAIDRWHVTVYGLTQEQADTLFSDDNFSKYEFDNSNKVTKTKLNLKKDVGDCKETLIKSLDKLNSDYKFLELYDTDKIDNNKEFSNKTVLYHINNDLLNYEIVGDDAKKDFACTISFLIIFILFVIFSARLVIDTAFEISSKERQKQYGVLQSIGASKKQIIKIIFSEANFLSVIGIPIGILTGTITSYITYRLIINSGILEAYSFKVDNIESLVSFLVSPLYILLAAVLGYVWILFSAYGTGMRIVKISPIEAIRSKKNNIIKVKKHRISKMLLGWTGVLSAKNIRRSKKRFFITVLAATISLSLFSSFGYIFNQYEEYAKKIFNPDGYDFEIAGRELDGIKISDLETCKKSLDESGYFKNNQIHVSVFGEIDRSYLNEDYRSYIRNNNKVQDATWVVINFLDKKQYQDFWGSDQPIEYSKLNEENGYILFNQTSNKNGDTTKKINICEDENLDVNFINVIKLYEKIRSKEDNKSGQKTEKEKIPLKISALSDKKEDSLPSYFKYIECITLMATVDQYKKFADYSGQLFISSCLNNNSDYSSACKFVDNELDGMDIEMDYYIERFTTLKTIAAVRIFGTALIILISLIALINIANVISTGIINRRGEFSILKSLGMTNFQFKKIVCIECFQYVLLSAIAAMIIVLIIILLTVLLVNSVDDGRIGAEELMKMIKSYISTLPELSIASIIMFVFGIIVSAFPVRNIEKEGISESIRDID